MTKKHTSEASGHNLGASEELVQAQKQAEEYLANWKQERADFINYKKDEERRVADIVKYSGEGLVMEVVDVMDGLLSALLHIPPDVRDKQQDWVAGLEQVVKQFEKLMKGYGVERIAVQDAPFDPALHEAVGTPEQGGERLQEIRPGYRMHDKIIRPARVQIVK